MSVDLSDDQNCFVCGSRNPLGLKLDFRHPGPGRLSTAVTFSKEHQGYQGIVHGGLLATVLDEMVVNLAWIEKKPCMTAEITVRYKKAVRVGDEVFLEGRIEKEEGRVLLGSAEARNAGGEVLATAAVKCLRLKDR